jgi:Coenzyme PQQ synthesis protein D (PqqD)
LDNAVSYTINAPDVIAEMIDGEAILVHLATGSYYSLEGSGADVWAGLMNGRSPHALSEELAEVYLTEPGEIEAAILRLVADLRTEQIIVEAHDGAPILSTAAPTAASERRAFIAPALKKFTDMQEIILLDPVHEVDQRGWPHQAEDVNAPAGS